MRLLILTCFLMLALCVSFAAMAQDKAVGSETAEAKSLAQNSTEETRKSKGKDRDKSKAKSSDKAEPETLQAEDEGFDLEGFFKRGEEKAQKGASCQKPPEPIA